MARTTHIRIDGDFFVADLDDGGLRIGLKGSACLDAPATSKLYPQISAIQTEAEAEDFFYDVAAPIILGAN